MRLTTPCMADDEKAIRLGELSFERCSHPIYVNAIRANCQRAFIHCRAAEAAMLKNLEAGAQKRGGSVKK